MKEIAILILTHNAPKYVQETLETLNGITQKSDRDKLEIIVWDNGSNEETKEVIRKNQILGNLDKCYFSDENLLFAGGNNAAAKLASDEIKYYLLLNSDVRIVNPKWISKLLDKKTKYPKCGAIGYGVCYSPNRADGYALLIDRKLYDRYKLDEDYQWWWSVTKLQAQILHEGYNILGLYNHDRMLIHYGGKSGHDFKSAKGMNTDMSVILRWFDSSKGHVIFKDIRKLTIRRILSAFKRIVFYSLRKSRHILKD